MGVGVSAAAVMDLCPACVMREQGPSGFCEACEADRARQRRMMREAREVQRRRDAWSAHAAAAKATDAQRQARLRLAAMVRPRQAAPAHSDPWVLAHDALLALRSVRIALVGDSQAREQLAAAEELVRQLAWGLGRAV